MDLIAIDGFIFLSAAIAAVIATRLTGLGSVVGYIFAGVAVGPGLQLADLHAGYIDHFSELGIVMMLFLIGLEISPPTIWRLRNRLIGMGGLHLGLSIAVITGVVMLLGPSWREALLLGCVASLSSTAIALQTLEEKALLSSEGGRSSFAVLLFQDLAVIPMLSILPLLSVQSVASHDERAEWIAILPPWAAAVVTLAAILSILGAGHYLSRPLFRLIARLRLREMFTAVTLLLVFGIVVLMSSVGLSPALGAFLAGAVLANSEFKHELQSDIEPFKGILLGLFFMTIGAKIEPALLLANWPFVFGIVVLLLVVKIGVGYPLARIFGLPISARWLFALSLAPAGEFGFVLLSLARERSILSQDAVSIIVLAITMSMVLSPALFLLYDAISGRTDNRRAASSGDDAVDQSTIIIAGVGRFGQIVNRVLLASGYKPVVLDFRADMIDTLRKFGVKSYFGDAGRPELLIAAGVEKAELLVVAIDDSETAIRIVEFARKTNPSIQIIARAHDRLDYPRLASAGADHVIREMFAGSLEAAGHALRAMGVHPYEVEKRCQLFGRHDENGIGLLSDRVRDHTSAADNEDYILNFLGISRAIEAAMMSDRQQKYENVVQRGWTPPYSPEN